MTIFALNKDDPLAKSLSSLMPHKLSPVDVHRFPDEECRILIQPEDVSDISIVVSSLARPDSMVMPLLFLARTLRDYQSEKIILIAPYLAYMRQDKRFNPGESITANYFAEIISGHFDALLTVDPHLHRIRKMNEVYTIPARVVHAAEKVSDWISEHVRQPLLVGPDSESHQWVSELAELADAPFVILEKIRYGDREVEVSIPYVENWYSHTPVLYDDIIATGNTMLETIHHLSKAGLAAPVCIGVHGLFTDNAYQVLLDAGASRVVSCNTIMHESNAIDLAAVIAEALVELVDDI